MKEKFNFIYETVKGNMEKLDKKQINVEQAKAMSSLAKQANNVLVTQLDASKFLNNVKDATPADTNTVLQIAQLSMEEILKDAVRRRAAYQVQFAHFDKDAWTIPCQLTENRMKNLLNDSSVRKVRLELEM